MTALGPMLATLVSMSQGGQAPIACDLDSLGVTIRLGDRVQFFVELPRVCALDTPDDDDAAGPLDVPDVLQAVLASSDTSGIDDDDAEPQANVAVSANDETEDVQVGEGNDSEEEVTRLQIAELDERDDDAVGEANDQTASVADVSTASAEDEDAAEEDQPVASDSAESQEVAPDQGDSAPADTESITGPTGLDLVSNAREMWLDRFDRVRDEVRDAFRTLLP